MNVKCCIKRPENVPLFEYSLHTHSNWEITLNVTGIVQTVIGGRTYEIKPGDIMVIPPNIPHQGNSITGFTDFFLQASDINFSDLTVVHDHDGAVYQLLQLAHRLITEQGKSAARVLDSILESITVYIHHYLSSSEGHPAVRALKEIIYEHLSDAHFKIENASARIGFDKDYLRRLFKKETGMPPIAYLTELRIRQAKQLLKQQGFLHIEEIAGLCGFQDSFYFSTCFKKHTGHSPLQYRKTQLAKKALPEDLPAKEGKVAFEQAGGTDTADTAEN